MVFGWIGIATLLAVFFGVKCHKLENEEKPPKTIEEHISEMTAEGYTPEEIEAVLRRGSSPTEDKNDIIPAGADLPNETLAVSESITEAVSSETEPRETAETDISLLYPEMRVTPSGSPQPASAKDVFLTFEGAPSNNMSDLLIILSRQKVTASFFLEGTGESEDEHDILRSAVSSGNTAGILAGTDRAYSDAESYLADFNSLFEEISEITGIAPMLYRIPDSAEMNAETRRQITDELAARGFVYCEYNTASDDKAPGSGWQEIYDRVTSRIFLNKVAEKGSVVLLHGGKDDRTTVYTVEDIIIDMTAKGYSFKAYTENTVI
ncbi:MAG: polysaccharide deacetylase family protein [Oscillospiraceae bacterium]|nr:polysaccharide deacetylase family protein [Oscillospiraceae bacterium]